MRLTIAFSLVVLLAGCYGSEPEEWDPFFPSWHLHNIWHEFLENDTIIAHAKAVHVRPDRYDQSDGGVHRGGWIAMGVPGGRPGEWDWAIHTPPGIRSWPAGDYRDLDFPLEPPRALKDGEYYWYEIETSTTAGDNPSFTSGCYRPDGKFIVNRPGRGSNLCEAMYDLKGGGNVVQGPYPYRYLLPDEPEYKRLVWDCCRIRSLPEYDRESTHYASVAGLVSFNQSFPVQAGATDGLVSAVGEDSVAVLSLRVVDPAGDVVASAGPSLPGSKVSVQFKTAEKLGVWRVFVEGNDVPLGEVQFEIHVNAGDSG